LLSEAYGEEAMKNSSVFEWHKYIFKEGHVSELQMKTVLITCISIKGIVHFEFIPQGQLTKLIMWK
jgi:hypothetical protein